VLEIAGLTLLKNGQPSELFAYQQDGLEKALSNHDKEKNSFFFFNWGTGCGKTVVACAGAQELFNRKEIDIVLVFTLRQVKSDFTNACNRSTTLRARNIEGLRKKRHEEYLKQDAQVYVLNYEKARKGVDLEQLKGLILGKRVLFVFDEVQKILNNNTSRAGMGELFKEASEYTIWPMSASLVKGDPERFWKTFDWMDINPLGTIDDFRERYVAFSEERKRLVRMKNGYVFTQTDIIRTYDHSKLEEVKERVDPWSHAVRKSDPGVREFFKGLEFNAIPLELSDEDRELYDLLCDAYDQDKTNKLAYYNALRYTCLTAESHLYSKGPVSKMLVEAKLDLKSSTSNKMERVLDDIEELRDGGDKVLLFTHYTNLSLKIIDREMNKRGIRHTLHFGEQNSAQNEEAKALFKSNPDVTVLLSSDAGAYGMNMQEARVVMSYDTPYDYDTLMQRNDRIDRADSWLDGLEARMYFYSDTVEERIWEINNARRQISSAVQGTTESLSRDLPNLNLREEDSLDYLMGRKR
jgi:superfamily II DNA or RNA helicase